MAAPVLTGQAVADGALAGRVALVTGASRGIGAATAVRLARAGARVAVTARTAADEPDARLPGSLARTLAAIEEAGAAGFALAADLLDAEARAGIVPAVEAALGPVDILVNNAAAAIYDLPSAMPLRRREVLFALNVHAPVDLAQAVLPGMRGRRSGWIVNLTSATARPEVGPPYEQRTMGTTTAPYGASKAALERFTAGLAAEVWADGVAVNAVAPVAGVLTEGADALVGGLLPPEAFEPVEYLVEAIAHLTCCPAGTVTGRVTTSQAVLRELGLLPD